MTGNMFRRIAGVTLIELVIVIVIISLAVVASLSSFSFLAGHNATPLIQTRIIDLAQLYADEILAKRFDEDTGNGGSPAYSGCRITDDGENRANFDDVDDYNGLDEAPAFSDQNLAAYYSNFRVQITVTCDNSVGVNKEGAKRVDILVSESSGEQGIFTVYRGNF